MSRKVFFMISLIALFAMMDFAAAQPQGDDLAHQSESEKNSAASTLLPLLPLNNTSPIAGRNVDFSWSEIDSADRYRLEVEDMHGKAILSEMFPHGVGIHRVPSAQLDAPTNLRWRAVALDKAGRSLAETPWRTLLPLSSECELW